jgi:ribokinase
LPATVGTHSATVKKKEPNVVASRPARTSPPRVEANDPGSRGRVVVVGSANEDLVVTTKRLPRPGETVAGSSFAQLPGGKGANQAVAAARAGADVYFVGAVGADDAGSRCAEALRSEGVNVDGLLTVAGTPTGRAAVLVSDDGENEIVIFGGANDCLDADAVQTALGRLELRAEDVCLVCFEVGDGAVAATAEFAKQRGCRLVVNPAPARPIGAAVLDAHPVLVPNRSEAELISGVGDPTAAAARLHEMSDAPVVVTLGAGGALVVDSLPIGTVAPLQVEVRDTTGAGDTLTGALAASLAEGVELPAAVRWAVAAASLSVRVVGARPGSPRRKAIEEALATQPKG